MNKTDTFLSDLGAEMRALFNSKIADWSLTNPIDLSLDTEGGAKLQASNFQRLERLFDIPIRLETAFIPDDLFDFETTKEDVAEDPTSNTKQQIAKSAYFSSNNSSIRKDVPLEKKDVLLQNSTFDSIKDADNNEDFKDIETFKTVQKAPRNLEKASEMPDILRGGIENVLGKNKAIHDGFTPQFEKNNISNIENEPKSFEKLVFSKSETTQKVTATSLETNDDTAADSIWQRPLGNLGAFAALSNNTVFTSTTVPIDTSFSPSYQRYEAERETDLAAKTSRLGTQQKQQPFENGTSNMEKKQEQNEQFVSFYDTTYFEKKQTRYLENAPENTDFIPIDNKEQPNDFNTTTLTDELFDALTERVRRDFKRFYP